jgi:hypothetical protein
VRVTDPYDAAPEPASSEPASSDRSSGCGLWLLLIGLFTLTFVAVAALMYLRAPDPAGDASRESPLSAVIVAPEGYDRLSEDEAGGGRLDETRTGIVLSSPGDIPGFEDALLLSWGRPRDEAPRAVVVLAVQLDSAAHAEALLGTYRGVARVPGVTEFPTQAGWVGFHQREEGAERYAQRVAFTKGDRLFVVSVVSPEHENDTSEVLALARRQAASGP